MPLDPCLVALHARLHPAQTALLWAGRSMGWDAFNNYVHSTARYLKEISVRPHAKVLIVKEKSPAYVIVLVSLWRIGAVPCPVDPEIFLRQPASIYDHIKPDIVISARGFKKMLGPKARWADIEHVVAYGYNDIFLGSEASVDPGIDPDRPALLRLRIVEDVVHADVLTHQELRKDPRELAPLLHALRNGETYTI